MTAAQIRRVKTVEEGNKILKKIADKTTAVGKAIQAEKEIRELRQKVAADTQGGEPLRRLKKDLRIKVMMLLGHHDRHKYSHVEIRKVLRNYRQLQRGKKELASIK